MNEDKRFVMVIVAVLGDRFEEGCVGARREDELGWSTHDGRLVAGKEVKLAEIEELSLENEVFLGPRSSRRGIPFGCFLSNRYSTENRQKDVAFFCRFGKCVASIQKMGKLQFLFRFSREANLCYNFYKLSVGMRRRGAAVFPTM